MKGGLPCSAHFQIRPSCLSIPVPSGSCGSAGVTFRRCCFGEVWDLQRSHSRLFLSDPDQVHSACKEQLGKKCPLGLYKVSIIPPTALNSIDSDGEWEGLGEGTGQAIRSRCRGCPSFALLAPWGAFHAARQVPGSELQLLWVCNSLPPIMTSQCLGRAGIPRARRSSLLPTQRA